MGRFLFHTTIASALCFGIARADMVTNGDFATGDLTGWSASGNVSVQLIDGSHRAVMDVTVALGSIAELDSEQFTVTRPSLIEVDALYSYNIQPGDLLVYGGLAAVPIGAGLIGQTDLLTGATVFNGVNGPLGLSAPTQTFSMPIDPGTYKIMMGAFVMGPGTSEVTFNVTNFRIIPVPEPSAIVLGALGLAGLFLFARRKRRPG